MRTRRGRERRLVQPGEMQGFVFGEHVAEIVAFLSADLEDFGCPQG